jgi:hypothetical protein
LYLYFRRVARDLFCAEPQGVKQVKLNVGITLYEHLVKLSAVHFTDSLLHDLKPVFTTSVRLAGGTTQLQNIREPR